MTKLITEINLTDYLTQEELKSIAEEEFRKMLQKSIKNYLEAQTETEKESILESFDIFGFSKMQKKLEETIIENTKNFSKGTSKAIAKMSKEMLIKSLQEK